MPADADGGLGDGRLREVEPRHERFSAASLGCTRGRSREGLQVLRRAHAEEECRRLWNRRGRASAVVGRLRQLLRPTGPAGVGWEARRRGHRVVREVARLFVRLCSLASLVLYGVGWGGVGWRAVGWGGVGWLTSPDPML
jgi:hypothetical protein